MVDTDITDIRYGPIRRGRGTVEFNYRGEAVRISEPTDVILVGTDHALAAKWITDHYGYLLEHVDPCPVFDVIASRALRSGVDEDTLTCRLWTRAGDFIVAKLRAEDVTGVSDEDLSVLLRCAAPSLCFSLARHARDMDLLTAEMLTAPVMVTMFDKCVDDCF